MCAFQVHISIYKDGSEEVLDSIDTHVDRVTWEGSCAADLVEHRSSVVIVCYWPLGREALDVEGKLRATISRKIEKWQMNEANHAELQQIHRQNFIHCRTGVWKFRRSLPPDPSSSTG